MYHPPYMTGASFDAYDLLSHPVWVFATSGLDVLAANKAAQTWLGFDARELQQLTQADFHLPQDRNRLAAQALAVEDTRTDTGVWTIKTCSGTYDTVAMTWSRINFEGTAAIVASIDAPARSLSISGQARGDLLFDQDVLSLFRGLPGKLLVMRPKDHVVVAVTDDYANAVRRAPNDLLGRDIFNIFRDDPDAPEASCARELRASVLRVQSLGITDVMSLQTFPITIDGAVAEVKFWLPRVKPVFNDEEQLIYIVHRIEDVTDLVAEDDTLGTAVAQPDFGLLTHLAEARATMLALQERDTRLRAAERLLGIASWELDFEHDTVSWSDRVFDIYGIPYIEGAPDLAGYFALVHPDDLAQVQAGYLAFAASDALEFSFQHRIIRPDGTILHIRGVGARHSIDGRAILVGFLQDVTNFKEIEEKLRQNARRNKISAQLARLGHWTMVVGQEHVSWSDETASIHDEPPGTNPSLEQAVGYYLAEHRDRIRAQVYACLHNGDPIDETLQITTAKGRRVWVRKKGEAVRDDSGRIVAIDGAIQDITDIVVAKDEAATLSVRLQQTLENMSDAFMLLGYDWTWLYLNAQAETYLGHSRAELIGKNLLEEFPDVRGNPFHAQYARAMEDRRATRFQEYSTKLKRWLEVNVYPTPEGLAIYARDRTQRRQYEERLRLLENAVSRQNDILLITGAGELDGPAGPRIVYVNEAFTRRTGYTMDEVIGKTPRILQGPKTQRSELDRIRRALQQWQPVQAELINYTKSGEEFWLELDIVPLADGSGGYTHFVAIERDITKRKQAEQDLKTNEERFRLIAKATGTAVWEWDVASGQDWWSEGFQEIFGHRPSIDDAAETQWMANIHPEDKPRIDASVQRLLDGKLSLVRDRYRFKRSDGSWADVEDRAFAIRDADGTVSRIIGSMTDISEQVKLEERLRQAQKMEAVGRLTGGVAHDFNNLLTIILGNAEILTESLEGMPDLHRMADMTANAAERGAELINRLLAFSRKQPLEPKVLDIGKHLQGIDDLLRRALPENIDIEVVRAGGLWKVELDAGQLETAILNLVLNARDAMPDGGCLTIEMANAALDDDYVATEPDVRAGQYVMLSVTDTGEGIPKDLQSRVFEPFFTTKSTGKGSGLGLSTVYGFVKQSGGHIRIYSEAGEGASFKLYFPRTLADHADRVVTAIADRALKGGTEAILVVEDEEPVREHVVTQLESLGYKLSSASTGPEALSMLQAGLSINLLFTDVVMPGGMGGRDLAIAARRILPDLKVLFTSGYTENSIVHNGKLDKGVDLLSKPYRRQQLARKVRKVLDSS